jgi:hypothetical protein
LPQLSGAKGDARRFGEALTGMKGSIYGAMQIDPFLEATDPRNAPPTRIRESRRRPRRAIEKSSVYSAYR